MSTFSKGTLSRPIDPTTLLLPHPKSSIIRLSEIIIPLYPKFQLF